MAVIWINVSGLWLNNYILIYVQSKQRFFSFLCGSAITSTLIRFGIPYMKGIIKYSGWGYRRYIWWILRIQPTKLTRYLIFYRHAIGLIELYFEKIIFLRTIFRLNFFFMRPYLGRGGIGDATNWGWVYRGSNLHMG